MGQLAKGLSSRTCSRRNGTPVLRRIAGVGVGVLLLGGCGGASFDPDVMELSTPIDGRYPVEAGRTYSVSFDCLLAIPRNSTSIANDSVALGDVTLLRNPRKTLRSDILTSVEGARIVPREFETWIWLDSLDEVEINSPDWPQERVRSATKRQLYWAMQKSPRNGPYKPDGPIRARYFRAEVVEYRLEGSIKFRIPSGLAKDLSRVAGLSRGGAGFYLPFVFASQDLGGEGVGFVIEGSEHDSEQYSVGVSQGSYCDRFKDRNIWR